MIHLVLALVLPSLHARAVAPEPIVSAGIFPSTVHLARPDRSTTYQDIVFLTQVGQTLVEQNEVGEIMPGIAKSWEISPDRKRYLFRIRSGITFHDGSPLTAEDIVHSLNQGIYSPDNASYYFLQVIKGYEKGRATKNCAGIRATDSQTVEITLDRPYTPLLMALSSGAMVIGKKLQPGQLAFIGTGPYRVVREGEETFLDAFPGYLGAYPPKIKRVQLVTDTAAMVGETRLAPEKQPDFYFIYLKSVFGALDEKEFAIVRRPGMLVSGFWINQDSQNFPSRAARIRLIRSLSKVSHGTQGPLVGLPLTDVFPRGMLGHDSRRASYRKLLATGTKEDRISEAKEVRIGVFAPMPEGNEAFARRFEQSTGCRVTFIQLHHERLLEELGTTRADAIFLIWKSTFLDPETNLTPFEFTGTFDRNPHRALFESLRREATTSALNADRAVLYGKIADLIFAEGLFLPSFQLDELQAVRHRLKFSGALYRYSPMLSELELKR